MVENHARNAAVDRPRWMRMFPIAPEGAPLVLTALIGGLVLVLLGFVVRTPPPLLRKFLPMLVLAGPIIFLFGIASALFFRDPERRPPADPEAVLSAADGRVTLVEKTAEGVKIAVFMSVLNVHINRAPVAGRVREVAYKPGEFLGGWKPLAEKVNERVTTLLDTPRGRVQVAQIAGVLARRIVCRVRPGDVLAAGDRIGLIRFGSCAVVVLPVEATPLVRVKDRVRAGVTPIARWPGPPPQGT